MSKKLIVRIVSIIAVVIIIGMVVATTISAFINSKLFIVMFFSTVFLSFVIYAILLTAKWLSNSNRK